MGSVSKIWARGQWLHTYVLVKGGGGRMRAERLLNNEPKATKFMGARQTANDAGDHANRWTLAVVASCPDPSTSVPLPNTTNAPSIQRARWITLAGERS